jgi:hypothetical protein
MVLFACIRENAVEIGVYTELTLHREAYKGLMYESQVKPTKHTVNVKGA